MHVFKRIKLFNLRKGVKCNSQFTDNATSISIVPEESCIKKSVSVSIVGDPNSGKSTLINSMTGFHICAASKRAHTTREYQRVFHVQEDTRIILLDTPGITSPRGKQNLKSKLKDLSDVSTIMPVKKADVVGVLFDASCKFTSKSLGSNLVLFLNSLPSTTKLVLLLNKIDLIKDKFKLLGLVDKLTSKSNSTKYQDSLQMNFSRVFMISARTNDGVESFIEYLCSVAQKINNASVTRFSDHPDSKIVEQRVKAGLLEYFPKETPYECSCEVEYMKKNQSGTMYIAVIINCHTKRHMKIISGDLEKMSKINDECKRDFEKLFGSQVVLELYPCLAEKSTIKS